MKIENILGIDYGDRAIGLAVACDKQRPEPLATLMNDESALDELKSLVESYNINRFIVGWPRNLDGESTAQTKEVEDFARRLKVLRLPVTLQDEAVTSELAAARLPRKIPLREAKELTHQYAAVIILEDYLANQT